MSCEEVGTQLRVGEEGRNHFIFSPIWLDKQGGFLSQLKSFLIDTSSPSNEEPGSSPVDELSYQRL